MTEPDGTRRLTDAQRTVVEAVVLSAASITDAAAAAGVTRQTASGWLNHDPVVIAAANALRADVIAERVDTVRQIDAAALAVVARAIDAGDTRAALAWCKLRRVDTVAEIPGPTDPVDVILDAERRDVERSERAMFALIESPHRTRTPER